MGISYIIRRNEDETDLSYDMRKWFIGHMSPSTKDEYENAIILSEVWVNWKFLGCIYPLETMKNIQKILENVKNKK